MGLGHHPVPAAENWSLGGLELGFGRLSEARKGYGYCNFMITGSF